LPKTVSSKPRKELCPWDASPFLSRHLEADLDAYAKENKISVSGAVTRAIQAFLSCSATPLLSSILSQALAQLEDLLEQRPF